MESGYQIGKTGRLGKGLGGDFMSQVLGKLAPTTSRVHLTPYPATPPTPDSLHSTFEPHPGSGSGDYEIA